MCVWGGGGGGTIAWNIFFHNASLETVPQHGGGGEGGSFNFFSSSAQFGISLKGVGATCGTLRLLLIVYTAHCLHWQIKGPQKGHMPNPPCKYVITLYYFCCISCIYGCAGFACQFSAKMSWIWYNNVINSEPYELWPLRITNLPRLRAPCIWRV